MVKHLFLAALIITQITGCTRFKKLWNESAPERKTVVVRSGALPAFTKILDGTNDESIDTLEQWRQSTLNSFKQIQGEKTDFISETEITVLIRSKMIALGETEQQSIERAHSVIRLLGFKNGISMHNVNSLFNWLEVNRDRIRTFYSLFINNKLGNTINSASVIQMIELASSLITLGGEESLTAKDMSDLLLPFIPENLKYIKKSSESGFALAISFFSSFCGDRVEANQWNGKKIGNCLTELVDHFRPLAAEVDFIAGGLHPIHHRDLLIESNKQLLSLIRSWMKGHNHPPFRMSRISDFAEDLEIPRPYNFFKLTEWLPKLNPKNTTELFHPDFMLDVAGLIENFVSTITTVTKGQACDRPDWFECGFTGKYETLDKLYNDNYAFLVRSKNLRSVYRVALFESVVKLAFQALDKDQTGYLGVEIKDLLTLVIRAVDTHTFADNVFRRLSERPVYISNMEEDLKAFEKSGLSEVAAMAADILPQRDTIRRTFWKKLKSHFTRKDKVIPNQIDALGLTGLLYIYDVMADLHIDYVKRYHLNVTFEGANDSFIKRVEIAKAIPSILHDHFPRIYNSCLQWGFERTCGVVFTQILPNPLPGRDDIQPYEMDMMSLVAIFAESIMSRCDRDNDGYVRASIFDGNDEKVCTLKIVQALVNRLMEAGIMEKDVKTERLVNLVTGNRLFRYIGKAALGLGSLEKIALYALPGVSLLPKPANLGSILSLTAELMNDDRVKAIKKGVLVHTDGEGPGDELVYLNQMTDKYLPDGGKPAALR